MTLKFLLGLQHRPIKINVAIERNTTIFGGIVQG